MTFSGDGAQSVIAGNYIVDADTDLSTIPLAETLTVET